MGKKSQSSRRAKTGTKSAVLAKLERRFAQFRAEHPRGKRIPAELRTATLAALRAGVAPGDLYRTCRISWSQIQAWKSGSKPERCREDTTSEEVRVFSVIDPEPVDRRSPTASEEHDLELRLGRWSVHVRLTESAEV